ncbi:MAG: hypothetical protein QXH78_04210 [Desulfurococcaceae archaeon]
MFSHIKPLNYLSLDGSHVNLSPRTPIQVSNISIISPLEVPKSFCRELKTSLSRATPWNTMRRIKGINIRLTTIFLELLLSKL